MDTENIDIGAASRALRLGMLENDMGLKETAARIERSIGTVKRALKGSMGEKTAYRILKQFGGPPVPAPPAPSLVEKPPARSGTTYFSV